MPSYKLTYFDIAGGRAEYIRIAFHAGGIAFDDHRISFDEFQACRSGLRFTCVPVLEIEGDQVTQSDAIARYVARLADLYPTDPLQALYCDEVLGAYEDLTNQLVRTMFLEGDALRSAREELVSGWLTTYLKGIDRLLARGGGEYFADNRLTIADLKSFVQTRSLQAGFLDHVPTDIVQQIAPGLAGHHDRIAADPVVTAYYAK